MVVSEGKKKRMAVRGLNINWAQPSQPTQPVSRLVICLNFCIKVTLRVVLLQWYVSLNGKGTKEQKKGKRIEHYNLMCKQK